MIDETCGIADIRKHLEAIGALVPGCPGCQERYDAPDPLMVMAPSHKPSSSCKSGKRPHCTCDACF